MTSLIVFIAGMALGITLERKKDKIKGWFSKTAREAARRTND